VNKLCQIGPWETVMRVCILDPGFLTQHGDHSANLGDLIIQGAVVREVNRLFHNAESVHYSTHSPLTTAQINTLYDMDVILVGGTNLLSSRFRPWNRWNERAQCWSNQWSIHLLDALRIRRAILLGTGWVAYQREPDLLARLMHRTVLDRSRFHSVRDEYSRQKLMAMGISHVLNTSCVTMWDLAEVDIQLIPTDKGENALLMLTDYAKNHEIDARLLKTLKERYKQVYAWPQGTEDVPYLKELEFPGVVLERSLPALDAFIQSDLSFDYIGTRLHGGIRCLQNRRRTLIIEVDNRAAEIAKDTGLPTLKREDFTTLDRWIEGSSPPDIRLPLAAIQQWRDQFKTLS